MGFSGTFLVARADRPLTELAAVRAWEAVPTWWARDGDWQLLRAYPLSDPPSSLLRETGAPALVAHVVDSDFATIQAATPDGAPSWQCALPPGTARDYGLPEEWIGDPTEVTARATAWCRQAGVAPDPEALRAALTARADPLAEDLVLTLVDALGFRFRDGADLEERG
ncbi:hypothetical protein AB0G79_27855 [Streptomyces sp. NPDC020807]|uniref:hypothetical protein n=1 Tax=Streptomyces sp. NPDC020807 TaxID=3155119 RepID=UPI00340D7BC4